MDLLKRIQASFDRQRMMTTLGAHLMSVTSGEVRIEAPILPGSSQQHGYAHGALAFAIGDSAAGYAALSLLDETQEVVTAEMQIQFLAPAQQGPLVATGTVIKPGRRRIVVRADVTAGGTHVATLLGSMVPVARS